jgi:ATP-dependent Clp protease ATP-binding subunit ClpA
MPKLNVYVPDDLAESVKALGLPVSAICQRALEQSVKRVGAIRAAVLVDLKESDPTAGLTRFTQRAKDVVTRAIAHAAERAAPEVGTKDLLHGLVTEGTNLALHVLRALEVDPEHALHELEQAATRGDAPRPDRFGRTAANALELTVTEAILLGHNYIGCEHLLLGLLAEPDGAAGQVLRTLGVESKAARQAVSAALAGYVHLQSNQPSAVAMISQALEPVIERLERLEQRIASE